MKQMQINWDRVEGDVAKAVAAFETATSRGQHGDGLWHYLRAYLHSDGIVYFCTGVEPSRTLPESEYFARQGHPVTLLTEQSCFSPGARDGLEWVDCEGDESPEYFRDPTGEDYVSAEDFDQDGDAGWIGFRLGEPVEPPVIDDTVAAALEEMMAAWGDLSEVNK